MEEEKEKEKEKEEEEDGRFRRSRRRRRRHKEVMSMVRKSGRGKECSWLWCTRSPAGEEMNGRAAPGFT